MLACGGRGSNFGEGVGSTLESLVFDRRHHTAAERSG